jgi:prefoldin subunit 5
VNSLDQAINRLRQSVDTLEASISVRASKNTESDGVQAQVKQLQARCDRLLEVTKQVDEGLDKTIDRLKFVLEG